MPDSCVISGMGLVTALGAGVDRNWDALVAGECGIRPMTRFQTDRYITGVAGEVCAKDLGTLREELADSDISRAYAFAMWVARQALGESGVDPRKVALILSTTKGDFEDFECAVKDNGYVSGRRFNPYVMATDLGGLLGLSGPICAVSNACASGLVAIMQGARWLQREVADYVLVVGVDILTDFVLSGFSCLRALSPRPARPFDAARDGLSLGEGAAAIVMSRLSTIPDADVRARVLGWSVSNDAEHITSPSREGSGLRRAMESALLMADRGPKDIGYINAHGTGTTFNDEMESQAVSRVYADMTQPPTTSMKGSIGHTLGAAGVIEAVLTVRAMEEKLIPPSVGFETLGVTKDLNVSSSVVTAPDLQNALCMKSGFGGVNATLVLGCGARA